jgi:hypothetical protein
LIDGDSPESGDDGEGNESEDTSKPEMSGGEAPPGPRDELPRCALHPLSPALISCSHCGTFCCTLCTNGVSGTICKACVAAQRVPLGLTPWEQRDRLGWLIALWETIRQVTVAPTTFFKELAPTGRLTEAAGFAFLVAIPGSIVGAATQFFIGGLTAMLPALGIDSPLLPSATEGNMQIFITGAQALIILIFGAPMAVLWAIISGCIHHLGLLIVGGGNKGLEASVKGSLYAGGVHFWAFIPMFKLFTDLWTMVLQGIAYCHMHGNPGWKGAFAVLYATCLCACGIGFIVAAVAAVADSMGVFDSLF